MKSDVYYFHQTPEELAKVLISKVPIEDGDVIYEPFKGEGAFYNNFPVNTHKLYTEIEEGLDFRNMNEEYDWVITNPPFRLQIDETKRVNSFFYILDYYYSKVKKGIALLTNDKCFSSLTPLRLKKLNDSGLYIHNIIVCNVKKWRGRYFFIIFKKEPCSMFNYILGSF